MTFISKTAALLARAGAGAGLAAVLALPLPALAGAIDQLHAFVNGTQAASGSFSQVTRGSGSQAGQAAPVQAGTFSFQRPGRFRWAVAKPYEQLIVSDGKQLFQYDPDLSQVTVREVGEAIGASPAQILFGSGSLEQSFDVAEQPDRDGLQWLRATPKTPEAGFSRVDIAFKDGLPARLELLDAFGQTTAITFNGVARNPQLPADSFRFTAPAGVDVVRMGGASPAARP
ncbi:Outer-membrane lipoprotein carrier protein precursor [Pigmentiphaga humi]|uniref:Outer-membrane lipoprotein carrier protein n=1 Tax=Pigmentiphaga humi TaxID=2478468 RepID=A0A3P4B7D1_9BURK|nr:outer membrane lipoprotein chaperone LolA [Pigmentiphaga humi]VCU71598.1 Outer-membrane lipoprotein carrier protein precursor [Pigmentiphaga humi]